MGDDFKVYRVIGPPGCGKTTYLGGNGKIGGEKIIGQVEVAAEHGLNPLVTSMTRAAAAEAAGRNLPIPREMVATLHSFAYTALGRPELADTPEGLTRWNQTHYQHPLSGGHSLDEDNAGGPPSGSGGRTSADEYYAQYMLCRAQQMDWPRIDAGFLGWVKLWEDWKAAEGLHDFTDLLEFCLRDVDQAPGHPGVIFADEAQDNSFLENALLQKWGEAAGHLVLCGDPYQNIYEWRGSDASLFLDDFDPQGGDRLLRQSYRVSRAVHETAMRWIERMPGYVPIEYLPRDEEGSAFRIPQSIIHADDYITQVERIMDKGLSVMILASCSYMLDPLIATLRKRGIPFHNPYRRTNGRWNPLGSSGKKGSVATATRVVCFGRLSEQGAWRGLDLKTWIDGCKLEGVLPKGYKREHIHNLPDLEEIPPGLLEIVLEREAIEAGLSGDYQWLQGRLLSTKQAAAKFPIEVMRRRGSAALNETPKVMVGTIHSVKGGEADVVLLAPDISPQGQGTWKSGDAGKAAIYRLFYVALTRARQSVGVFEPIQSDLAMRLL